LTGNVMGITVTFGSLVTLYEDLDIMLKEEDITQEAYDTIRLDHDSYAMTWDFDGPTVPKEQGNIDAGCISSMEEADGAHCFGYYWQSSTTGYAWFKWADYGDFKKSLKDEEFNTPLLTYDTGIPEAKYNTFSLTNLQMIFYLPREANYYPQHNFRWSTNIRDVELHTLTYNGE